MLGMLCSCRNRNATRAQASREHATGARARVCGLTGGEHDDAPFLANLPQSARSLTARHFELTCEKGGWIRAAISGPGRGHPYPGPTGGTGTYRYLYQLVLPGPCHSLTPDPSRRRSLSKSKEGQARHVCACAVRVIPCAGPTADDGAQQAARGAAGLMAHDPRPRRREAGGGRDPPRSRKYMYGHLTRHQRRGSRLSSRQTRWTRAATRGLAKQSPTVQRCTRIDTCTHACLHPYSSLCPHSSRGPRIAARGKSKGRAAF